VESDLAPVCKEFGIGLTTFSPLYYGILTGKYADGIPEDSRADIDSYGWLRERITPERLTVVQFLSAVAKDLGLTTAQLATGRYAARRSAA